MPNPACSTSVDGCHQAGETKDQPSVTCSGARPWLMAELEAGSDVYFKAFVTKQTDTQLCLRFPACQETKDEDIKHWVSRCSSRLWRGANAKGVWTKMNNGEGAWRPKKVVKAGKTGRGAGRPAKRRATADNDAKEDVCSGGAEQSKQEDRQEGMAECSHRDNPDQGNAAIAPPQEPETLYLVPKDCLKAYFYKERLVLASPHKNPWTRAQQKSAESESGDASRTAKVLKPDGLLARDDSAMESDFHKVSKSQHKARPKAMDQAVAATARPVTAGR